MFLKNFVIGIIIGIGFIIPGVSGGVLATILGVYNTIIDKLINFFKKPYQNFLYLSPLFIGITLSIIFFSKAILYFLDNQYNFISYLFIGLILGCVPFIIKEIKIKSNKNISLLPFILSLIIGIILFVIENNLTTNTSNPTTFIMILAGFMYALGKIVPGISGAALLMLLGIYKYFLQIVANPFYLNIDTIKLFIPFIISFILSAIIILKTINFLLTNHFRHTYSAILGFVLSSILFIYPGYFHIRYLIISALSFTISYYLSK